MAEAAQVSRQSSVRPSDLRKTKHEAICKWMLKYRSTIQCDRCPPTPGGGGFTLGGSAPLARLRPWVQGPASQGKAPQTP